MSKTVTISLKNQESREAVKDLRGRGYNVSHVVRSFLIDFCRELKRQESENEKSNKRHVKTRAAHRAVGSYILRGRKKE